MPTVPSASEVVAIAIAGAGPINFHPETGHVAAAPRVIGPQFIRAHSGVRLNMYVPPAS